MSSQIRISKRLADDMFRFRSLHNAYEEKAGYGVVTLAASNEIDILHAALSRASIAMEDKIGALDKDELQDKTADLLLGRTGEEEGTRACDECGGEFALADLQWYQVIGPANVRWVCEGCEKSDLNNIYMRARRC